MENIPVGQARLDLLQNNELAENNYYRYEIFIGYNNELSPLLSLPNG